MITKTQLSHYDNSVLSVAQLVYSMNKTYAFLMLDTKLSANVEIQRKHYKPKGHITISYFVYFSVVLFICVFSFLPLKKLHSELHCNYLFGLRIF